MNIFFLFNKKPKQAEKSVPVFNIKETRNTKVDFEVSEISYEEYQNAITKERRQSVKHPSAKQLARLA